jgi:DNA-directed RNA polymerase subunit RPC12/RpoP
MDIFHDMKKYRTGKTPEGYDEFSIPFRPDDEGMVGRECPNEDCQPKYFKIFVSGSKEKEPENIETEKKDKISQDIFCPYCGYRGNMQEFHTREQIEWIKSMLERDMVRSIQDTFRNTFRHTEPRTGSFFSMEFKPGRLPSVRHYAEENLKRNVACNKCGQKYAVYGIAYHCPSCGGGNILVHFERSKQILQSLLDSGEVILENGGEEAFHHHLGNCLEDVVSLFEGFHKSLYSRAVKERGSREEAEEKITSIKTNFQRLSGAEAYFRKDLGVEIFSPLSSKEMEFLEVFFLKRHVITHNLGLVDQKYLEKAKSMEGQGRELEVSKADIEKGLELVDKVIREEAKMLGYLD